VRAETALTAEGLEVGVGELARRFIEALNSRDRDGVRAIVTDDIALRNPFGGEPLSGERGLRALVLAVEDADLQLVREGDEKTDGRRVEIPVRVTLRSGDELLGTALFEVRDGKVAAFEVLSELVDP
jgi:hypothetical protein